MTTRTRLRILAAILLLIALVWSSGTLVVLATDWLWYDAAGYASVFTTSLAARVVVGTALGGLTALIVATQATLAARLAPDRKNLFIPGDLLNTPAGRAVAKLRLSTPIAAASLLVGILAGFGTSVWWEDALLFVYGSAFGTADPVLGLDVGFYVFRLPMLRHTQALLTAALTLGALATVPVYIMRGGITVLVEVYEGRPAPRGLRVARAARIHLAVSLVLVTLAIATGSLLSILELQYRPGQLITGMGYAELWGTVPATVLQAAAIVAAGVLAGISLARARMAPGVVGGAILVATVVGGAIYPPLLANFWVNPTELEVESPYMRMHIDGTRAAFALDAITEHRLTGDSELSADDIAANRATIDNVNLWRHKPLLDTFRQVQEIRTYYDFASVDNDRYIIDGKLRQIMVSPRELVVTSLPPQARTFVNETMTYTHGYGVALGPVNEVSEQGLPRLFVKDLPPWVEFPDDLGIDQPAIYFGESMPNPVLVNTQNEEFDYPRGEDNVYTRYAGAGGVPVSNVLTRAMFALRLGSSDVLLTGDVTENTRILLYRNIVERVGMVAPFLTFDADPYIVIDRGRLVWVIDGYTSTDRYPYSRHIRGWGNYIRNSVKATVDAYDGTITLYRVDDEDPILAAWAAVFPDLLRPGADIPSSLRAHLRYPEDLFRVQATLFAVYHMTETQVFYNSEDAWEVPQVDGQYMSPYYTVMKLPGSDEAEFIVMLPFNPVGKPNLAAWMVARNDGEHYGKLRAYIFPKEKLVYGPGQIAGRIQQDAEISQRVSLWNQQGSRVVRGTLMVIPIEESLIYIQPLYMQAESDRQSIPELKRVIVAYENRIVMEPTLDGALARLFGAATPAVPAPKEPGLAGSSPPPTDDGSLRSLIVEAQERFEAASAASRDGDWARYGVELEALEEALTKLAIQEGLTEGTTVSNEPGATPPAPEGAP